MNHKKITTTPEVWAVIMASHRKALQVFSSYSNPTGDCPLGNGRCEMLTEYGFPGTDFPIMGARTTWDKGDTADYKRLNEETEYWLCVAIEEKDLPI